MKILISIILTLIFFTAKGQNQQPKEFGIGFAIATDPFLFDRTYRPNDIFIDKELTEKLTIKKVSPFFYKPDYGLYHFICLVKTKDYYKILINDSETGFIPNNENYYFKTWDAIIMNSSLERNNRNNQIRENWTENSKIIINECEFDRLKVTDIMEKNGEYWVSVSFAPNCETYPNEKTILKNGWIKWRTKEKLLVDILLLC